MLTHYETRRLNLDILTPDYCSDVLAFYRRNRSVFQPYEPAVPEHYYTEQYQYHALSCEYELFLKQERIRYYLTRRDRPQEIIGTISFSDMKRGYLSSAIVGYKLDAAHHHQGYASEALTKCISCMFHEDLVHRLTAYIVPDNAPSIRLMERLGFSREGIAREYACIQGVWQDHLQYSLIHYE